MQVYGYFDTEPASFIPQPATTWPTKTAARRDFCRFAGDCDRWGQSRPFAVLYIGEPAGDEPDLGYPDYPDLILERGPRGGLRMVKL